MSGQTLTDRIAAAQYSVTGSAVARAVCKATTHEVMGPKKKHLDSFRRQKQKEHEFKVVLAYIAKPDGSTSDPVSKD